MLDFFVTQRPLDPYKQATRGLERVLEPSVVGPSITAAQEAATSAMSEVQDQAGIPETLFGAGLSGDGRKMQREGGRSVWMQAWRAMAITSALWS